MINDEEIKELEDCGPDTSGEVHARLVPDLIARLKSAEDALKFYADGFAIMDHIDGTYTIHDTWYAPARAHFASVGGGE